MAAILGCCPAFDFRVKGQTPGGSTKWPSIASGVKGYHYVISHVTGKGDEPGSHPHPRDLPRGVYVTRRHFESQNGGLPSAFLKKTALRRRARFARAYNELS